MNKRFLHFFGWAALVFCSLSSSSQIANYDFELWATDTTKFAGIPPYLPAEDFSYNDPSNWTTSNSITGMTVLGNHLLVSQSSDPFHGSSALEIHTDTIARVMNNQLTVPGFALNGYFTVELTSLIGGLNITPMSVAGAGQPFSQKLAKFKGHYKYNPVFNPNTNSNDTCLMWATLRKGKTAVADAIFKSTVSTGNNYAEFEATFNYHNCETPDTLVVLLSSSIPKSAGLISGQSNLVRGSVLLVDSIYYEEAGAGYEFNPIVRDDKDTTLKNTAKTVDVVANDEDCDDNLTISIVTNPANGTATVQSNKIIYTPNNEFVGQDSVKYEATDGNSSNSGWLRMYVKAPTAIDEALLIPMTVFPNPANNQLNFRVEYQSGMTATIFDALGKNIGSYLLHNSNSSISTSTLAPGSYHIQIMDNEGKVLARKQFAIQR